MYGDVYIHFLVYFGDVERHSDGGILLNSCFRQALEEKNS